MNIVTQSFYGYIYYPALLLGWLHYQQPVSLNLIRRGSHELVSVASTIGNVPELSICSQLCASMTTDAYPCNAFSYDQRTKVCNISTDSSILSNDVGSATTFVFSATGISFYSICKIF